jgi:hypothetical protein
MNPEGKSLLIRWAILVAAALVVFVVLAPMYYTRRIPDRDCETAD